MAAAAPSCNVKLVGEGPGGDKNCEECNKAATVFCPSCTAHFCNECDGMFHRKAFQKHARVPVAQAPALLLCKTHGDRLAAAVCEHCDRQVSTKSLVYLGVLRDNSEVAT
jgi:hypothetical protein